jgi:magnesium transporter
MFSLIEYNESNCKITEGDFDTQSVLLKKIPENYVQWIDIDICNNTREAEKICEFYGLHLLTTEDILKPGQLPKFEAFDNYFFLSLKMLHVNTEGIIIIEHISLVVGNGYILSFQEIPGDVFDEVRQRIQHNTGYLRKRKSDYLFIRLLDSIIDNYGYTLEHIRQNIVDLEGSLLSKKWRKTDITKDVLHLKKELNTLRGHIAPLRDILTKIKSETAHFFHKSSIAYLNDIQDQSNYLIHNFENFREMLKDLMDLYNSKTSNELNHIMKTLTIISALFIPLTFVAGWYGMNFDYMPELAWEYSYPTLTAVMLITFVLMFIYMKNKRWF